jgi:hypothetical protein
MKSMVMLVVAFYLAFLGTPPDLKADMILSEYKVTVTAKVAGMDIRESDLYFTPKPAYVHVIVDVFPNRDAIRARGNDFRWAEFVKLLATKVVFPRYVTATAAVIAVVELPERDDYGAARWDQINKLGIFDVAMRGLTITVKERIKEGQ